MTNPMSTVDSSLSSSPNPSDENYRPSQSVSSPSNHNTHRFPPRRSSLSPIIDHLSPISSSGIFQPASSPKVSRRPPTENGILGEDEKYFADPAGEGVASELAGNKWGLGLINFDEMEPKTDDVELETSSSVEPTKDVNGIAESPEITINFELSDLAPETSDLDLGHSPEKQTIVKPSETTAQSSIVGTESTMTASPEAAVEAVPETAATSRTKATQGTFASRIRRRSWMPGSRSPSPKKADRKRFTQSQSQSQAQEEEEEESDEPLFIGASRKERLSTVISNSRPNAQRNSSFSKQFAQRLRKRPSGSSTLDTVVDESPSKSSESLFSRMQKSASEDKLSLPNLVPGSRSSDRLSSYGSSDMLAFPLTAKSRQAKKRDELWSAFRDLDNACQRFNSKHLDQKGSVLRASLLPFLQEYQLHSSNLRLHPEDLDRRAVILYKWWTTLLEFLKSRTFPMAANGTRTMVLDSIIGLMERPEWRHYPSPFCPVLAKRNSDAVSESNSSNSENDYLVESVQHNIRNYFSQCLLSQMAFAVDKMSSRAVPSLVSFCGKTCAYAFFFCPGVAALLVQLWRTPMDVMKRVLEQNGLSASGNFSDVVDRLSPAMPPTQKDVQFCSLSEAFKFLRVPVPIPVGTENIAWKGAWVDRWSGQDTDLFYAFVRQYYILLFEYVPEPTKAEKVVAAGGLFVQAQMLVNMDATIRRHIPKPIEPPSIPSLANPNRLAGFIPKESSLPPDENRKPAAITFDDVLADPDSSASPVPFAPTNADRIMAENRLIMLLRDVLVTYASEAPSTVRESFARTFADLMRAVAKTTPQFNRFASDALCDFVEEAVIIFVRYEQINSLEISFMDWSFWFEVWKRMALSNNYFTEMKVYSILYTLWPAIALDPQRKAELCLKFLLDKDHFESRFSHWSPMVRSYYMRLLAWRVARCHEVVGEDDLKLVELLADRLMGVYSNYLYLRENGKGPTTSPSNPAPSRRFIIVRADHTQSTRSGPVITFDAPSTPHNAAYKRSLMLEQLCSPDVNPEDRPMSALSFASSNASDSDRDLEDSPKRWTGGLLRTIIGTSKHVRSQSHSPSRPPGTKAASAPALRPSSKRSSLQERIDLITKPPSSTFPAYRTYCFRFSLELVDRRMHTPASMQLQIPRLPQPAQLLLTRHLRGLSLNNDIAEDDETPAQSLMDDKSIDAASATEVTDASDIDPLPSTEEVSSRKSEDQAPATINPRASWAVKLAEPTGQAKIAAPYCGRALAEWTILVSECHMFFERRKAEGVPGNRWVETPLLGTEVLRRAPL